MLTTLPRLGANTSYGPLRCLFGQRWVPVKQAVNTKTLSSNPEKPIPFLNSKARNYGIEDSYKVQGTLARVQRFGVPLGLSLFALIMYLCYIRDYGDEGEAVMDFLTQDVKERFPEAKRFPENPQKNSDQN